jgi:aquaporin Z
MQMKQRFAAEMFGTCWLVLGGCGSAVLAAKFPGTGIGFAGVSLAFGLTVLTMAYTVGHISGGHFNPAVSVGLTVAGRLPVRDLLPYIIAQVIGGILGAFLLSVIANGAPGFDAGASGFATNGYGAHSPGHYSLLACIVCEVTHW